jgi:hypothetical protein
MKKKIAWFLLIALIVIQFIKPAKNQSTQKSANDISTLAAVPANVQAVLDKACNDCHSNNTRYPWYSNIQPIAWWLAHHVDEGKGELNFSEFASYSPKKQAHKLEETIEMVKEGEMPLDSYTWTHKDAILTTEEKLAISAWADELRKSIMTKNNLTEEIRQPEGK